MWDKKQESGNLESPWGGNLEILETCREKEWECWRD